MVNDESCSACHCGCGVSRRGFLGVAGAAAGAAATWSSNLLDDLLCFAAESAVLPKPADAAPVVDVVFVWKKTAATGNMDWVFGTESARHQQKVFIEVLEKAGKKIGVQVRPHMEPVFTAEEISTCIERLKKAQPAGLIVCGHQLYDLWKRGVQPLVDGRGDIPTVVFSNGANNSTMGPPIRYAAPHTYVCTAPRVEWLETALRLVAAPWQLKHARLLHVTPKGSQVEAKESQHPQGPVFVEVPNYQQIFKSYEDRDEVQKLADFCQQTAKKVVEPERKAILNAVKHYLVLRELVRARNCRGAVVGGSLCTGASADPGPACVAISRLNDEGLVGTCEADHGAYAHDFAVADLISLMITGRPIVMGNTAPQTITNTLVISHCYSPTKLRGPDDEYRAPYQLRDFHGRAACVIQVFWPVGEKVTLLTPTKKEYFLGSGHVASNIEQPPAFMCRTAVELAVDGLDWDVKTYRVDDNTRHTSAYILGDVREHFDAFAQLTGLKTSSIVQPRAPGQWGSRTPADGAAGRTC